MIKRRFYKLEHGDRDAPSDPSSSSSDSDAEAEESEEEVEEYDEDEGEEEEHEELGEQNVADSSSSGYESEDGSGNEVNNDPSELPSSDDDVETQTEQKKISQSESTNIQPNNMSKLLDIPSESLDYILKCKSVFKCRICPRVVLLSEETLLAHLKSKKHARSEKLLREGRLKLILNDYGVIEGEEEHSPIKQKKKTEKTRTKGIKKERKGKRSNWRRLRKKISKRRRMNDS